MLCVHRPVMVYRGSSCRESMAVFTLLLLPVLASAHKDQKIITAVQGQNVTLTCRAPNNNNIIVVEWSRADLGSDYVLLYRDEQPLPDNQHPSFKNWVDLQDRQMKAGDVSLILKNVTADDAGTYECRIKTRTNLRKRANLKTEPVSTITLRVAPPPGPTGGDTEDGGTEDGGTEDGGKEDGGKEDGGKKDGGKEDGGKEDGGKEDGSVGLIVGLSVAAVVLVVAAVGFLIYRKCKQEEHRKPSAEL